MTPAPKLVALCCSFLVLLGACTVPGRQSRRSGGSIVIGIPQIGSLDPPRAQGPSANTILRTACDGLVGLDPESGAPRPALAESWTLQDGASRLNLTLRPGMRFHDGTPVTSAAVREALSRVARPSTSSPWADLVSKVVGFSEVQAGSATNLSGVRASEDLRLQIELSEPYSEFPTVLSHPALLPVSLDSLESLEDEPEGRAGPVCAGPYLVEEGLDAGDLRLIRTTEGVSRNDAFLSRGRGLAERILVRSFESPEDAYQAYKTGRVDMAPVPDSRLGEAQASGSGYVSGATPRIIYLAFDPENPATADPRFRQAISLAIDRLVIIDAAYGDRRRPATRWLPGGFGPATDSSCRTFARRIADPNRARELFGASGVNPGAVELRLFYDPQTTSRLVAEALQLQLTEGLGIAVEPRALEGEDIAGSFQGRGGDPAMWIMRTSIELPLPDQFLGDQFRTGSDNNALGFSDPTYDAKIEEARAATDEEEIERLYVEAESALCNQMPAIPLWTSVSHWMINPEKVGFENARRLDSQGSPLLRHARASRS